MKAIVYSAYGSPDVLRYEDVEKPAPGDQEVLIKVRAASVNPLDWHLMRGRPYMLRVMTGLREPKTTRAGVDVAGVVEAVGKSVTQFKPGDEVFGACEGSFAEYVCAAESALVMKSAAMTFEQAASLPIAASTALQALRDTGRTQSGQKVLINGAAGGVGTFAVQIAKSFGAEVTGVCSTRNVELVRSIGADHVTDYTREDFTKAGRRYDVILDCIANHSLSEFRRILEPKGTYLAIGVSLRRAIDPLPHFFKLLLLSRLPGRKMRLVLAKNNQKDLAILQDLIVSGKVTSVIERTWSLRDVPEAVRHLGTGHARGRS